MSTNWSPQVARAMHELSNAAPAAPSVNDLDRHQPSPPRRTSGWVTAAAAVIVIGAIVGLVALIRRDDPAPVDGPATAIEVQHNRFEVTIDAQLTCDHPTDTTGTFSTYVVDTYADRAGRQWRTTIAYPDGSTLDHISQGSAIYPTGSYEQGEYRASRLGCVGPNDEPYVLSLDVGVGGVFALNVAPELSPDERPYVRLFTDDGTQVAGDHVDSRGRPSQLWEQRIDGFAGYGNAADRPLVQIQRWWVDPADESTVTEHQFVNTIDGLGTATVTQALVSTEATAVPPEMFDTTGYRRVATFPRPDSPPGLPNATDETLPSPTVSVSPGSGCGLGTYRLVEGDTPVVVATKFDLTVAELDAANVRTPGYDKFVVGVPITIPPNASLGCPPSLFDDGAEIIVFMNPGSTDAQLALVRNALDELGPPIDPALTKVVTADGVVRFELYATASTAQGALGTLAAQLMELPNVTRVARPGDPPDSAPPTT
jgi:hypothetical protein